MIFDDLFVHIPELNRDKKLLKDSLTLIEAINESETYTSIEKIVESFLMQELSYGQQFEQIFKVKHSSDDLNAS